MAQVELDCKGLNCPMPIVKISRAIRELAPGDRLIVEANDPAFRADLEAWARRLGHAIEAFETGEGAFQRAVLVKQ